MRTYLWLIAAAVGGLVAYAFYAGWISGSIGVSAGSCQHDEEIDASWRAEPEKQAAAFIANISTGEVTAAYDRLTEKLKSKVSAAQFGNIAKQLRAMGPYSAAKLEHIYRPSTAGTESMIMCVISGPDGWVQVRSRPGKAQAHLLYATASQNSDWAWTLWMSENAGSWEVVSFNIYPSSLVGHNTRDLLKMAKDQDAKGHAFNAHMLYVGAAFTGNRGPDFMLGIAQDAQQAAAKHPAPPEIAGKPPFAWTFDGTNFSVETVQILAVDKQIGLLLIHRDAAWDGKDNVEADRRNKKLIDGFAKKHPEYKDIFGFLVARIMRPGEQNGWGTVFSAKTGYIDMSKDSSKAAPK